MAIPKLTPQAAGGDYTKIKDGENKLRIVSDIIAGWEYWTSNNKPVRSATDPGRPADCRPPSGDFSNKPTEIWVCAVYNYDTKQVELWGFGQRGIMDGLTKLAEDPEWGDPQNYGIKVFKNNDKGKISYSVMPGKEAPLTPEVAAAVAAKPVSLDAYLQNGNPFDNHPAPGTAAPAAKTAQQPVAAGAEADSDNDLPF